MVCTLKIHDIPVQVVQYSGMMKDKIFYRCCTQYIQSFLNKHDFELKKQTQKTKTKTYKQKIHGHFVMSIAPAQST